MFEEEGYSRNDRLYYDAVELLKKAKTMRRIQSLWAQEDDYSSDDDWFLTRANDYIHALYTTPADQLASFVSTLGFRGRYLTHGICSGVGLELRSELDYTQPDFCFYGCSLNLGDMVASNWMVVNTVTHKFFNGLHTMDLTMEGGDFSA